MIRTAAKILFFFKTQYFFVQKIQNFDILLDKNNFSAYICKLKNNKTQYYGKSTGQTH